MQILVVDSNSQPIELRLVAEGFNVFSTYTGEDGIELAKVYEYDIILLDLNLRDMTGYEVIRQLRRNKNTTPILVLSEFADVQEKVLAFKLGADECLPKPFDARELIARIHAVVRRSRGFSQSIISVGDVSVNITAKTVEVCGKRINVTHSEYRCLEVMILNAGKMVSIKKFLSHLYHNQSRDEPCQKIVGVFICKLRKKIASAAFGKNYITTIWGRGFMLGGEAGK